MPCGAALLDGLRIEARTDLTRMSAKSKPRLPLWIALAAAGCAIGIVSLINAFLEYWLGWIVIAAVVGAMLIMLRRIAFRGVAVGEAARRERNRDVSDR
jgi:Flp pilus assembly protein TadB